MRFRTEYKAEKAEFSLTPEIPVMLLGSCFADNIRERMRSCLWNAVNPLGVLYNPLSIEKSIRVCLTPENFDASLFQDSTDTWHTWLFDSKISDKDKTACLDKFHEAAHCFRHKIKEINALFVTFGTSWCYFLADKKDHVVANCHKQPSATFIRRRVACEEIVSTWMKLAKDLKDINPGLRIIFTVSPVRHVKDGLTGNARSKAILLLAVGELCSRLGFCSYFPAYEIVNDDLRDYRFYTSDLVHPNEQAVEYIWEIFRQTYLDPEGEKILREGENIRKAFTHRPLIETEEETRQRIHALKEKYKDFFNQHPGMISISCFMKSDA